MSLLTAMMISMLAYAMPPDAAPKAEVTLVADADAFVAGEPMIVGLRFELRPTWHVYWKNPGDAGLPPRVEWHLPEGFTAGELQFPVPKTFESAGSLGYGYSNAVTFLATITPPSELPDDPVTIGATVKYLVCDPNVCLPEQAEATATLRTDEPTERNRLADAKSKLPEDAGSAGFSIDGKPGSGVAELSWVDRQRGVASEIDVQILPAPENNLLVTSIETGELKRNLMNGEHTLPIVVVASKIGPLSGSSLEVLLVWTDADGVTKHYELDLPYRLILE
ncbi:MAG: protein-disulfide reductase DsbD domain-containing protein [Planctomycetota bacterium]